jgi:hypothetical protein
MLNTEWLNISANIAAIVTALLGGFAYGLYRWEKHQKRLRLENHLRQSPGPRPVIYLAAELGMTEAEIMDTAFRSKHINRQVTPNMHSGGFWILLRYRG